MDDKKPDDGKRTPGDVLQGFVDRGLAAQRGADEELARARAKGRGWKNQANTTLVDRLELRGGAVQASTTVVTEDGRTRYTGAQYSAAVAGHHSQGSTERIEAARARAQVAATLLAAVAALEHGGTGDRGLVDVLEAASDYAGIRFDELELVGEGWPG